MNRTLVRGASRHVENILSSRTIAGCCQCSVNRGYSTLLWSRSASLQSPSLQSSRRPINGARLYTMKIKTVKPKGKATRKPFPLLEGEEPPKSRNRPRKESRSVTKSRQKKVRQTIDKGIEVVNKVQAKEKEARGASKRAKKAAAAEAEAKKNGGSQRIAPSAAQHGVYSPVEGPPVMREKKEKEPKKAKKYTGRPKTQKRELPQSIQAKNLLKNYTPDFSVELPNGEPIPTKASLPTEELTSVRYPYFIKRTASDNLPVYNEVKAGGSLQITQIRNVEGDPRGLLQELQTSLDIPLDRLIYHPLTKKITVKMPRMKYQVMEVLARLGF